jgi:acetyl-CoA synthetase
MNKRRVCKMANVLKNKAYKRDRVCIYLPMIPELAITTLACARIGAISVVFLQDFPQLQQESTTAM